MPGRLSSGISRLTYGPTWVTGAASGQISVATAAAATACGHSEAFQVQTELKERCAPTMPVQITHNSTCVCVCAGVSCGKLYTCERRRQLSTGNWQHSNPISHACNHHDHYERKCRKSRRFLTATERPPSDRATNRPTDRVTPYTLPSPRSP